MKKAPLLPTSTKDAPPETELTTVEGGSSAIVAAKDTETGQQEDLHASIHNYSFEWSVYVDATLAGLSVLIPFPLLDNLFERIFRRRMVGAIAAHRGLELTPELYNLVNNRRSCCGKIWDCIIFPFFVIFDIIASFFKLLFYFVTMKKSTDALNFYWQRAFLLDYLIQRGHLDHDNLEHSEVAIVVMEHILQDVGASPLNKLAAKIVFGPCQIFCSLTRYVCCCGGRKQQTDTIDQTQETMTESWGGFRGYLESLATRYDEELASASQRPQSGNKLFGLL